MLSNFACFLLSADFFQIAKKLFQEYYLSVKQSEPSGSFPAILGKGPWPKLGKKIDLTSKLGEITDIEHYKGSKIYPQNQVILDCICQAYHLSTSV